QQPQRPIKAVPAGVDSTPSSHSGSAVPSPASLIVVEEELREEKRPKKTLKQILAQEKSQQWPESSVQYSSIDAPPTFKPAKKYSDVLGLQAKYTDPQTRLRFANSAEFACIRTLPNDIVSAYLVLRNAKPPV
ncbi:hypothetical protein B566_EDAN005049, partial [Ephemera danica]